VRGEAQKETEFGRVPDSWEMRAVGDFTHLMQYGLSIRGEASGEFPILRMNCQQDGKVLLRDLQYVNIDEKAAESYRVRPGDILVNRTNSFELVGRSAIVEVETNAVFASYLVRLALDSARLSPAYLNHFLNWDRAQAELKKLVSRGVSQANISAGKLRDFSIPIPKPDEQCEIVAVLDAIGRKIDLHRRKREVLDELFRALLHKLMTGEIRVADMDLAALQETPELVGAK
jgi:type I restriction enzyme S subunit